MHMLALAVVLSGCSHPADPTPMARIGERVVFSDLEFVIDSAADRGPKLWTTDGADSVDTPGRWIDVHFTVKNRTSYVKSTPFNPLLVDSAGHTHGGLTVGIARLYMDRGAKEYRWRELQPGEELPFQAIYNVDDPTATRLHLEVRGALPDEVRKIPLGL